MDHLRSVVIIRGRTMARDSGEDEDEVETVSDETPGCSGSKYKG